MEGTRDGLHDGSKVGIEESTVIEIFKKENSIGRKLSRFELPPISKSVKVMILPISDGIFPDKLFCPMLNTDRLSKFPISVGIVPTIALPPKLIDSSDVTSPISIGMVPFNAFPDKLTWINCNEKSSDGIWPEIEFPLTSMTTNALILPN